MIDVRELRIGNLLDHHGQTIHVMSIYQNGIECGYFEDSVDFLRMWDNDCPAPIPLTEDWLIKFGGINHGNCHTLKGYVFSKKDGYWQLEKNLVWEQNGKTHSRFFKIAEIKYVHSLQNFIFANTGKELELEK